MTMEIHHDKHHGAYVTNLNKALESAPDLQSKTVEELLANNCAIVPECDPHGGAQQRRRALNHSMFWTILAPQARRRAGRDTWRRRSHGTFGSFDAFKEKFNAAATTRFGSGWAWLIKNGSRIEIISTANQDSPVMEGTLSDHGPGCLGARVLFEVSEPAAGVHRGVVERGELAGN